MNKSYAVFVLMLVSLILHGCAKVTFAPTGKTYPPYQGPVKIYKTMPTDLKYEEIGWVTADGDFNHTWAELLQMMQKEAARRDEDRSVTAIAVRIIE